MIFRIKIDTTNSASFNPLSGFPYYWVEKLDTVLELPFHWDRKACTDSLSEFFTNLNAVPYQNLAGYENRLEIVQRLFLIIADTLERWDEVDEVNLTSTTDIEGGKFYVSVEEVPY